MNASAGPAVSSLPWDRTWSVEETSYYLGVPVATLHQWRYLGKGPKAARAGRRLRYLPSDVLAWLREQQAAA
ncbi:helix-turn-helix transcriptional regulator [Actinomadura mexicana]|uniref:Helix-turn-helix domain-containing protein n=1 Tax=Actinomadura mexicana TaxID=134959 RepID=A0A239AM86_9ACTN|nr:helix-turn-helix domain-containing protein [Actinomadura mexicana]SNR96679.1 Helix-turn-helix domain-containing protein [Actinomadura mexicana]